MPKISAALCSAAILFSFVASAAPELEDIAALDAMLSGIESLAADVLQLIVESDGGVLEESEIQMYLKKPGGFYWETLVPFPELVVTNGTTLWNYQPDLEQVVIEDWDSSRSELAAQLLNGQTDSLAEEYNVENVSADGSEHQEFRLTPLQSDNVYSEISINFTLNELDLIYLNSKNGQRTVWQFENVQRNQPLDDELFEFTPPDGVEVIENSYAQ
jgi:outer membrane lipoprotein carrier protein